MCSDKRGVIVNRKRKQQILNFENLLYGKCTPTDVDGLMELDGKIFFFFEVKYNDAPLPYGQRLALERLVDIVSKSGVIAVLFIASHYIETGDVDASAAIIVEYRINGTWHRPKIKTTLKQGIDIILERYYYDR